ncbi:MAG: hypothetical protein IPL39_15055 [Opitutaceae bacterium]|nr:hypothetical protein [Opitutaceae bacterium]
MTTRTAKDGPFCWQSKPALRLLRDAHDATNDVTTALAVYVALTECASNEGKETFTAAHAWIARLSGVSPTTIKRHLKTFTEVGLIAVEAPKLRAPARFHLLPVRQPPANDGQPSASVSQREVLAPLATSEELRQNSEEPLPGLAGGAVVKITKQRKPDPLFDALALHAEGSATDSLTKSAKRTVAVALAEIREASPDLTAAEIQRRAEHYRQHFTGAACTACALAKHWARCATPPTTTGRPAQPQPLRPAVC